jgi:hypothetical protein
MPFVLYPIEIAYAMFSDIGITRFNKRPKRGDYDVDIIKMNHGIIVCMDVGTDLFAIAVRHSGEVIITVEIMVAEADNDLLIMFGRPIPKRITGISVLSRFRSVEIGRVASYKQDISGHFQRMLFQPSPILWEFQMKVGNILYS